METEKDQKCVTQGVGSKDAQALGDGCEEFKRIQERYPGRIPIICSRGSNSDSVDLDKKKFLVSHQMKWKEFKATVAKHASSSSRHLSRRPLKATVGGQQPTSNTSMADLYKNHKSTNGFLNVTVEGFAEELVASDKQKCGRGTAELAEELAAHHVAQVVTSAMNDSTRDSKKMLAVVEQLGNRVAALESAGKRTAAETKQFGEKVAKVEEAIKKGNIPQLGVDAADSTATTEQAHASSELPSEAQHVAKNDRSELPSGRPQRDEAQHAAKNDRSTIECLRPMLLRPETSILGWSYLYLSVAAVLATIIVRMITTQHPGYHNVALDEDALVAPYFEKLQEETRKSENLSKVVQEQLATIQELKDQLQLAAQASPTWTIGSVLFSTLLATQVLVMMAFFVTLQKKNLPAFLKHVLWMFQGQNLNDGREQQHETHKEQKCEPQQEQQQNLDPKQQVIDPETTTCSSTSAFTYYTEETKSEQEIVYCIHIRCPPGGGVSHEHIEGQILTHGIRIRINKPGDKDLPALRWEKAFQLDCKEGSPTFDFRSEEAKVENDILTLVFRASNQQRIWKFPPHFHHGSEDWDLRDWHDMGGGEAPIGLYTLPEACSVASDRQSRRSLPARLQWTSAGHEQMSDGDSISQGNETEASHVDSEAVRKMRSMFGRCFDGQSEGSVAFRVASQGSIASLDTQPMPQTFDISSDPGLQDTAASQLPGEPHDCMAEELREAYVQAFKTLDSGAQSEVSSLSQEWEKPEITEVEA